MITPWDIRFLETAKHHSSWSKDESTKVGAVIVRPETKHIVAIGYNGMPRGINDDVEERHLRPTKYKWFCHAEENAILNSARVGASPLEGSTIYVWPLYPCASCARKIIQAGIKRVVTQPPDFSNQNWVDDFRIAIQMFEEAHIEVETVESPND